MSSSRRTKRVFVQWSLPYSHFRVCIIISVGASSEKNFRRRRLERKREVHTIAFDDDDDDNAFGPPIGGGGGGCA